MLRTFTKQTMTTLNKGVNQFPKNLQSLNRHVEAGIIVIGDEILKGFTRDVNSGFMCQRLHDCGVLVKKIAVVSDEVDDIANEVKYFSEHFDIVFTTGGIGPTHDDRTFVGIAKAFGNKLVLSEELLSVVRSFLKRSNISNVEQAVNKFCRIPETAKLIWGEEDNCDTPSESAKSINFVRPKNKDENGKCDNKDYHRFPSFQIENVFALPGVPSFCHKSFEYLQKYLFPVSNSFFSQAIFLKRSEIHLEKVITQIANDNEDNGVSIGSYPVMENSYFKTKLIVESESHDIGAEAHNQLLTALKEYLVEYDENPWVNCFEKLMKFREFQTEDFQKKIDSALQTLDDILDQYSLNDIAVSFNGGKDCTILLHLFRCCVDRRFGSSKKFDGFHVLHDDDFPELCEFVLDISEKYNLEINQIRACMKTGLAKLKQSHPSVVAVLMGSRSTDPNSKFMNSKCEWTDVDWPRFYRVCPIFDWKYSEVWMALRGLFIPYCKLYDFGYTSLGERSLTHVNPALRIDSEKEIYLPAYCLRDENLERCSRESYVQTDGKQSLNE